MWVFRLLICSSFRIACPYAISNISSERPSSYFFATTNLERKFGDFQHAIFTASAACWFQSIHRIQHQLDTAFPWDTVTTKEMYTQLSLTTEANPKTKYGYLKPPPSQAKLRSQQKKPKTSTTFRGLHLQQKPKPSIEPTPKKGFGWQGFWRIFLFGLGKISGKLCHHEATSDRNFCSSCVSCWLFLRLSGNNVAQHTISPTKVVATKSPGSLRSSNWKHRITWYSPKIIHVSRSSKVNSSNATERKEVLHPQNLTWNLKMMISRNLLLRASMLNNLPRIPKTIRETFRKILRFQVAAVISSVLPWSFVTSRKGTATLRFNFLFISLWLKGCFGLVMTFHLL